MNYRGECGREGGGQDGVEWGGKWNNCNSITNKYILKKEKKESTRETSQTMQFNKPSEED